MKKSVIVGIVQAAPVYLDAAKSLGKAVSHIEEAVQKGADLLGYGKPTKTNKKKFWEK